MITQEQVQPHFDGWRAAQFPIIQALCAADIDCAAWGMVSDETMTQIEHAITVARAALDALEATINECGAHTDAQPLCADPTCPCQAAIV